MQYLIKEASQLQEFEQRLESAIEQSIPIAVDTEFLRVRTYYAQLCLLQIGIEEDQFCIDVLQLDMAECLKAIFTHPNVVKVLHAARQDMEVLYHTFGYLPTPIFDTQLAYAFCNNEQNAQIAYSHLVQKTLHKTVVDGQARSDWSKRPLTAQQLEYAADDVAYLVDLFHCLTAQLSEQGKSEWYQQELHKSFTEQSFRDTQLNAYTRFSGGHLNLKQQAYLQQLAYWREGQAQKKNVPRHWILNDDALYALAQINPEQASEQSQFNAWTDKKRAAYRSDIRRMFNAILAPETPIWPHNAPLDKQQKKECNSLMHVMREMAEQHSMSPSLLAKRKDIETLYRHGHSDTLLSGWRKALLGEPLLQRRAEFDSD